MASFKSCKLCPALTNIGENLKISDDDNKHLDEFFSKEFHDKINPKDQTLSKEEQANIKVRKNVLKLYMPTGNQISASLSEMTKSILERDYPQLVKYIESGQGFEAIFVPDSYIPSNPEVLDVSKEPEILKKIETSKKINKLIAVFEEPSNVKKQNKNSFKKLTEAMPRKFSKEKANQIEKQVSDFLKDFYRNDLSARYQNIVVFQNIEISPKESCDCNQQEVDILLVNHSTLTISVIEVKTTLQDKTGESSSLEKVIKQLPATKKLLENWFNADLGKDWKFQTILFCKKIATDLEICESCKEFIAFDRQSLLKILRRRKRIFKLSKKSFEEFGIICRYLAYCASARLMPTTGNVSMQIQKAMEIASSPENIELWLSLNPEQMMILELDFLVFFASFGTGKTILMVEKAKILGKAGEKVLFLIIIFTENDSLLALNLRMKMRELKNVTIVTKNEKSLTLDFLDTFKEFDHILIDEFYERPHQQITDPKVWERLQVEFDRESLKTMWISISGGDITYCRASYKDNIDQAKKAVMKMFSPERFHFPELNINLRQPQVLRSYSQIVTATMDKEAINSQLLQTVQSPPNIAQGKIKRIKSPKDELLRQNYQIVYVIDEGTKVDVQKWARKFFKGHNQPLFLTDDPKIENSPQSDIIKWISKSPGFKDRDLITTYDYLRGFEHHKIAFLTMERIEYVISVMTRSMGEIIDATLAIEENGTHPCECFMQVHPNDISDYKSIFRSFTFQHFLCHGTIIINDYTHGVQGKPLIHLVDCNVPYQFLASAAFNNGLCIDFLFKSEKMDLRLKGLMTNEASPKVVQAHLEFRQQDYCLKLDWSKSFINKFIKETQQMALVFRRKRNTIIVEIPHSRFDHFASKGFQAHDMPFLWVVKDVEPRKTNEFRFLTISLTEFNNLSEEEFALIPEILCESDALRDEPFLDRDIRSSVHDEPLQSYLNDLLCTWEKENPHKVYIASSIKASCHDSTKRRCNENTFDFWLETSFVCFVSFVLFVTLWDLYYFCEKSYI